MLNLMMGMSRFSEGISPIPEKSAKTGSLEGLDILVKEIQREFDELALFLKRN
jgi:hypothetical protein